jgi:hypothetical protein
VAAAAGSLVYSLIGSLGRAGTTCQDRPDILDHGVAGLYNPATQMPPKPDRVPRRGFEPLPPSGEPILSRPRLPVPPPRHVRFAIIISASVSILP